MAKQTAEIWPTFDDWWKLYDKKVGKIKTLGYWKKLEQEEKELAMTHTPEYIKAQPNKKYRKDPERYLRHKCFEDEIIHDSDEHQQHSKQSTSDYIAEKYFGTGTN